MSEATVTARTWDAPGRVSEVLEAAFRRYQDACQASDRADRAWDSYGGRATDHLETEACVLAQDCEISVEEAVLVIAGTLLDRLHGGEVDPASHVNGPVPALTAPESPLAVWRVAAEDDEGDLVWDGLVRAPRMWTPEQVLAAVAQTAMEAGEETSTSLALAGGDAVAEIVDAAYDAAGNRVAVWDKVALTFEAGSRPPE